MGLFDRLLGRDAPGEVAPDARTFVAVPDRPYINKAALTSANLRPGMWVITADGVGILTGCRLDGLAEITLAKPDGTTKMMLDDQDKAVPFVVIADPATLRHAYIEEIPESRHEGADHLRSFGYINKSEAAQ